MSVYVDNARTPMRISEAKLCKMSHMIADTRSELDDMAERLSLKERWKQNVGERNEHFDVAETNRREAIRLGAKMVSPRELVKILRDRDLKFYLEH